MDLISEPWLPVIGRSGQHKKISLLQLWDEDIVDVAYPRPDFQGAAWQMLIGLLQTALPPEDEEEWRNVRQMGIEPERWQHALQKLSLALQFGPDKPSFLQSFDPLTGDNISIAGLLIDAPGGNTLKLNKDHFIKRDVYRQMCPHCAVMALFTVQTNAPAGGAGYRVGMRGGGPLTTLVVPENNDIPLSKKLWLNVMPQAQPPEPDQFALIFPWLTATKTSEKPGNSVTPENAHPLQAYWGMPRQIEIDFAHTKAGECDICGVSHSACLREMRTRNYGVQYDAWLHPFSPYRQALKDSAAPWLAVKGQPGGLSYKDWLGLLVSSEDKFNRLMPARIVSIMDGRRRSKTALWCFAYDMDNAKARCWYQHRMPLVFAQEPETFNQIMSDVIALSATGLMLLKKALKSALFETPEEAKWDSSSFDIAFWQETEAFFQPLFIALAQEPSLDLQSASSALRTWEPQLQHYLFKIFDREIFSNPDSDDETLQRQIEARRTLDKEYGRQKLRQQLLMQPVNVGGKKNV